MSHAARSVVMTEEVASKASRHLLRSDGQEDLCFALWRPSTGSTRTTAIIQRLVLPRPGDRNVHGNASFEPAYLQRAMAEAAAAGTGLALMHSHPMGRGWQNMSADDIRAEQGNAGPVFGATGRPFVGLTIAGNKSWSARFWERIAPRTYERRDCAKVRVVGERLAMHYMDRLAPPPRTRDTQIRTVSAWGEECQADLARIRIGLVGAGTVGGVIAEGLARIGFEDVRALDFDIVEKHNLDRLSYATRRDVGKFKVDVLAERMKRIATAEPFNIDPLKNAVYEPEGFAAALDCDVLFSCVDRPWGRYVLNLVAYAHLIPVFDGGIAVRVNKLGKLAAADWRAHTATVGRPCLQCLGQYDPGLVQVEREGLLDDPDYIEGLPRDHPAKMRENVYAFALSCGSFQLLQMLAYTIAPLDRSAPGAQLYHFVGGFMEPPELNSCKPGCVFPELVGSGDDCGIPATGIRSIGLVPHEASAKREWWLQRALRWLGVTAG